jgi:uncharacterized protein
MTDLVVISNSSPIIALDQINKLDLLKSLFSEIIIPSAVKREIFSVSSVPFWINEHQLTQPIGSQILRISLGPGESEAISLALEINPRWILLDDRPARRLAESLGLSVIGTLGILLASKRRGFLPVLRPCLDSLIDHGFRIAPVLYKLVLSDADEIL